MPLNWSDKENKSWWGKWKSWRDETQKKLDEKVVDLKAEAANKATTSKDSIDHYLPEVTVEDKTAQVTEVITHQSSNEKLKGLFNQITGNNQNNFNMKAEEITNQVNKFLELDKINGFPNEEIREGVQKVISGNIAVLAIKYRNYYNQWIKNSEIAKTIENFADLDMGSNQADNQSETYDQVELDTIKEQDVWSDRVKSPSVHSEAFNNYAVEETEIIKEKPKSTFSSWIDAIKARREDTNVVGSQPNVQTKPQSIILETSDLINEPYKVSTIDPNQAPDLLKQAQEVRADAKEVRATLDELIDKSNKLDDSNLMSAVKESFDDSSQAWASVSNKPELPEIKVDRSSSNNSLDHYFPETKLDKGKSIDMTNLSQSEIDRRVSNVIINEDKLPEIKVDNGSLEEYFPQPDITETDVKIGFDTMFKDIKSNRLEYGTPKIGQVGLGTSTPIQETPKVLSPLKTKPSITNLFDDTADLFDVEDDNIIETTPAVEEILETHDNNDITQTTPAPTNTPEVVTEELPVQSPQASTSSDVILKLQPDSDADSINQEIINNLSQDKLWNNIDTNIINNKQISINFHELFPKAESVYFMAEGGEYSIFDFKKIPSLSNPTQTFKWRDHPVNSDVIPPNCALQQIFVKDIEGRFHSIYKNEFYYNE